MLKYLEITLLGVPFTPGSMSTLLQNDHTEIFHRGCKRLLYPFCRMRIIITMESYHGTGDRRNTPEQVSCCLQLGSFGPDSLVYLSRVSHSLYIRGIVWYHN